MQISNQQSAIGNGLVECVPNFSEGRNSDTVAALSRAIESVETTCVLDHHIDPDHNRSVITFVAAPEKIASVWRLVAEVDEVIGLPGRSLFGAVKLIRRQTPFDVAILFPNSLRVALRMSRRNSSQRVPLWMQFGAPSPVWI